MKVVSGSNFQIKSLNGVRFPAPNGYVFGGGWGLWDASAGGWVRMGGVFSTVFGDVPAPYSPVGGRAALKAIVASGLGDGYEIIRAI